MTRQTLSPGAAMARVMAAPAGAPTAVSDSSTAVVSDPPTRLIDPTDLVAGSDIADRLRVSRAAISQWSAGSVGFPEPVARPGGRPVWLWTDVELWARHRTVVTVRTVARRTVADPVARRTDTEPVARCGAGLCRNRATWAVRSDLSALVWLSCDPHRPSRTRLMAAYGHAYRPTVERVG